MEYCRLLQNFSTCPCFVFHLGYYRTASDATSITLADGRREMADSEFGTGTNAEKVTQKFSLFYKSDSSIDQKNEHNTWYICHEFS